METPVKQKEGTTATKEKTGKRKWLGRIGTFLIMGGWLLVVFLILGIVILISVLTS